MRIVITILHFLKDYVHFIIAILRQNFTSFWYARILDKLDQNMFLSIGTHFLQLINLFSYVLLKIIFLDIFSMQYNFANKVYQLNKCGECAIGENCRSMKYVHYLCVFVILACGLCYRRH